MRTTLITRRENRRTAESLSVNPITKIYYELTGQGEPIVLIAGHRGDHSSWDIIAPTLARNFQVLTFDNLASGQTVDDGNPISIDKMADNAWALISKLNLERPTIVGESMGGAIAQLIAHKYAEKIHKLVIINSMMKGNAATMM